VTIDHACDLCGNPTDGYVCRVDADETARYLRHVVDLAPEVETNVARLARYATRNGRRAPQVDEQPPGGEVNRRQPVMVFGFAASRERILRNALRAENLPVDLNASARAAVAFNHVTTWARAVEGDRGVRVPDVRIGRHPAAVAAVFLLEQLDWMRHQPFADEAFEQLRAAGAVIARIVDRPPDTEIVGVCDCGAYLYARRGAAGVSCLCGLAWDVGESRASLMEALRDRLVTVPEATTLGVLAFPDLARERVRNLVKSWVRTDRPNHLVGVETQDGQAYPFGEIMDRLACRAV
jgi:hypothetical protein